MRFPSLPTKDFTFRIGGFAYFFALFLLLIALPISVVGGAFAVKLHRESITDVRRMAQTCLDKTSEGMERTLSDVSRTAGQYAVSQWVNEITYMQGDMIPAGRVDFKNYSDYTQHLRITSLGNSLTDLIAIAFLSKNYVVSSDGVADADVFFNTAYRSDYDYAAVRGGVWDAPRLLLTDDWSYYSSNSLVRSGPTLLFVQKLLGNYKGDTLFFACLPVKNIAARLEKDYPCAPFGLRVLTKAGTVLWENAVDAGETLTMHGGFLDYSLTIPPAVYSAAFSPVRRTLITAGALLLLLTVLSAYLLSVKQVRHVLMLEKLIDKKDGDDDARFRVSYVEIEDMIRALNSSHDMMNRQNELLKPLALNQLLLKLLTGTAEASASALESLKQNGVTLDKARFMMLRVCMEGDADAALAQKLAGHLKNMTVLAVRIPGEIAALLINCGESEHADEMRADIDQFFVEQYGASYGMTMFSGLHGGLDGARRAFQELEKFNDFRFVSRQNEARICTFSQAEQESAVFYYPIAAENRLIEALSGGDEAMVHKTLDEILDRNAELEWMSVNQVHILLFSLIYTARRALENASVQRRLFVDFAHVQELSSIDEARLYAHSLFSEVFPMLQDAQAETERAFGGEIQRFVDDNFRQTELSLTMLAAETGRPEYVLSREFKRQCGMGFVEYVQSKRVAEAQKLIAGGEPLKDMAQRVGFGSDITFRRTFKKLTGVTPSDYSASVSEKDTPE